MKILRTGMLLALFLAPAVMAAQLPNRESTIIKKRITLKYPNNYSMQRALLAAQTKSYEFLRPVGVPYDTLKQMHRPIISKYPYDFLCKKPC